MLGMATNKYPTYCTDCGEKKPAGHGQVSKVAGRWVVSHPKVSSLSQDQFPHDSDDGYDAMKDAYLEGGGEPYNDKTRREQEMWREPKRWW